MILNIAIKYCNEAENGNKLTTRCCIDIEYFRQNLPDEKLAISNSLVDADECGVVPSPSCVQSDWRSDDESGVG